MKETFNFALGFVGQDLGDQHHSHMGRSHETVITWALSEASTGLHMSSRSPIVRIVYSILVAGESDLFFYVLVFNSKKEKKNHVPSTISRKIANAEFALVRASAWEWAGGQAEDPT